MVIGILRLNIFMGESNSLKHKRMILHSFKSRMRNNFNVAVTQIDDEDKWQKATVVIAGVEKNRQVMDRILSHALNFTENFSGLEIIDYETELI
jgi:uncharacterized protein YlxP (DUF503 family)